jgi:two-component system cell cycle sensor histidine kinase/response regulator CckA
MEAANLVTSCPSWDDKTVLLVDDQIDVLITIKIMLQTCGYAVDAFNDPLLALDHFRRHSHDYSIVICDMILPSISGLEFIKNIRKVNREIVTFIIVTFIITALDNTKDISTDLLYNSTVIQLDGIIHKPILLEDLCRSVGKRR